MKRRDFIKTATMSTAAAAMARTAATAFGDTSNAAHLPKRPYGSDGDELSIIGFGGIVIRNATPEHASRVVAESVERGVNYFDVAPQYGDAEIKLGPALEPYRKDVFLACKTNVRDKAGAQAELERSLERLRTDYFDLYQLHHITSVENDVDRAFADDGAMQVLLEAKRTGQVRHLGFSAHSVGAAMAAMDRYDFDSALVPINFACWKKGNFGPQIVAKAQETGATVLALKVLVRQRWPEDHPDRKRYPKAWYQPLTDPDEARLGLGWALSQPIAAAIPPGEESLYRLALDLAADFRPITDEEDQQVTALAENMNPLFSAG